MNKQKCVISFSGGETSAYMLWWLISHKSNEFEFKVIFANTGQENEETLIFVKKVSEYFNIEVIWVESMPRFKVGGIVQFVADHLDWIFDIDWVGGRLGTLHKVVDFDTATRIVDFKTKPTPFEAIIAKFGIPNKTAPHCTRELKQRPIRSYLRSIGWNDYLLAIGIRQDEFDRINPEYKNIGIIYPLISDRPMTKPKINFWWSQQPFRLNLKGYEGNCRFCWKKNDNKLYLLAQESPYTFDFPLAMEAKYGNFIPQTRLEKMKKKNKIIELPIVFFRGNKSTKDILRNSIDFDKSIIDDSLLYDNDESESCEVFTQCGTK